MKLIEFGYGNPSLLVNDYQLADILQTLVSNAILVRSPTWDPERSHIYYRDGSPMTIKNVPETADIYDTEREAREALEAREKEKEERDEIEELREQIAELQSQLTSQAA